MSDKPETPAVHSVDAQMLSALEFLHYCRRFQDAVFAFCCAAPGECSAILMDLRVLLAARIRQVIFAPYEQALHDTVRDWSAAGDPFHLLETGSAALATPDFVAHIRTVLAQGGAVVVLLTDMPVAGHDLRAVQAQMVASVVMLGVKKIFFTQAERGLTIAGKFRSYPSVEQVQQALASGEPLNLDPEQVRFFIAQQEEYGVDLVLVQARRGAIFEEVFTHSGSGTLFTAEYPNILRAATAADVRDIMAMMQPYIADGSLKPVSEDDLLKMVPYFMVYSVNDQIVAAAALLEYGDGCEVAKLCTLPRYQARGRARALVRALLEEARARGKRRVFALTVHAHVGDFFERLGFSPVARETLPEEWLRGYDLSRPSRGYCFWLS